MVKIMESLAESSVLILFLCVPPLILFIMLSRRHSWTLPQQKSFLRKAMALTAFVLAFNLGVSTVGAPRLQVKAISDGIDWPTLTAMIFAWASIWCAIALAVLAPRRRYKLAALRAT